MTTSAPPPGISLPAPIAACVTKQTEHSATNGSGLTSVPADEVVFDIESYNPDFSRFVMKRGLNPQIPDGAVLLRKELDPKNGAITISCGIPALVSGPRGVLGTGTISKVAAETAEQMKVINIGFGTALADAKKQAAAQGSVVPGALGSMTYRTDSDVVPVTPLDPARAVGAAVANVSINAPNLTNTKGFVAHQPPTVADKDRSFDARGFIGGNPARDIGLPLVKPFSSPILQDEPGDMWMWILLIVVCAAIVAYLAYQYRERLVGLWQGSDSSPTN